MPRDILAELEIEGDELSDKTEKLYDFVNENPLMQTLPKMQQILLVAQLGAMEAYLSILTARREILQDAELSESEPSKD